MIKSFFQTLTQYKIKYLLISGQATVIYGAATFSEDIDLWIAPDPENWRKFLTCLNKSKAKIYKLTPPIKPEFIAKGHAYHFEFPSTWFLDVMGIVPRAGDFKTASQNARSYETEWGKIKVMGLRNLVQIKKTLRLADYPIISNLVRREYEQLIKTGINAEDWTWILNNSFEAEDIFYFLKNHHEARKVCKRLSRKCLKYAMRLMDNTEKTNDFTAVSNAIALEVEKIRQQDRIYWKKIIADLKMLKRTNQLLPIGSKPKIGSL